MAVDQPTGTIATLAASASKSQGDSEDVDDAWKLKYADSGTKDGSDPTMAAHAYQFRKVLELADVVLEVRASLTVILRV